MKLLQPSNDIIEHGTSLHEVAIVAVGKLRNCASRCEASDPPVCDNADEQIQMRLASSCSNDVWGLAQGPVMQVRTYLGPEANGPIQSDYTLIHPMRQNSRMGTTAQPWTHIHVCIFSLGAPTVLWWPWAPRDKTRPGQGMYPEF